MEVNSCKEIYEERENFANIALVSSWPGLHCATRIMISAVLATHFTEEVRIDIRFNLLTSQKMSSIVLLTIHFLIHSLKILMKL